MRPLVLAVALVLAAIRPASAQEAEPRREPLDTELEERVDVQLVLIDTVVIDRRGRTRADLTKDDFELFVNSKPVEIDTFDLACPAGATPDPRAGARAAPAQPGPAEPERRIVLVFDYFHMERGGATLDLAAQALERWSLGGEEHMVVSIGQVLEVETPFTRDPDEIRRALERMREDPARYAGNFSHLTEWGYFDRLEALVHLLERVPGRKVVVLFSGPFLRDGFTYDRAHRDIAALSARARVSFYPVDTAGLRTLTDPYFTVLGGPEGLRRLAIESGGRMTADTNDLSLAYARAHRDLGCVYTLGFYDRSALRDRARRVSVYARRNHSGLRLQYSEAYVLRSPDEKRRDLTWTARMAPGLFSSDALSAELVPLRPGSARSWKTLIAVALGPADDGSARDERQLRGYLRKSNGTLVHSFRRRLPPATEAAGERVRLLERARVRPGRYELSAVLSGPALDEPQATTLEVEIPEIPRDEPFVIGPILGRQHGASPSPGDPDEGFEPLSTPTTRRGELLTSLTRVCLVDSARSLEGGALSRELSSFDGDTTETLEPTTLDFGPRGKVRCHTVLDALRTADLEPGRYRFSAVSRFGDEVVGSGATAFDVVAAP